MEYDTLHSINDYGFTLNYDQNDPEQLEQTVLSDVPVFDCDQKRN